MKWSEAPALLLLLLSGEGNCEQKLFWKNLGASIAKTKVIKSSSLSFSFEGEPNVFKVLG